MKVYVVAIATILVFVLFFSFQSDHNRYLRSQENLKFIADEASAAAALYFDEEQYSEGYQIFNKAEGNKAIKHVIDSKSIDSAAAVSYYTYYFDGDGMTSSYNGDNQISGEHQVGLPYLFKEALTGYEILVEEPMVIVTIDAGSMDYSLDFIDDPVLIRTSGHEYASGE